MPSTHSFTCLKTSTTLTSLRHGQSSLEFFTYNQTDKKISKHGLKKIMVRSGFNQQFLINTPEKLNIC